MPDMYDLDTGLQVDRSKANNQSFTELKASSPVSSVTDTTGKSTTAGNQTSIQRSYSLNTTPEILKQLTDFISTLAKGGTPEQKALSAERQQEVVRDRAKQADYSPEAAKATAQGLSDYFTRVLTEQQLPSILRAAEGAGTSKGTTQALLEQQAIGRVSETAAKTGADLSVAYGGLSNQLAGILENLTKQDPNSVANQLIQAINVGKGIATDTVGVNNTTTSQTGTQTQSAVTNKSGEITAGSKDFLQPVNPALNNKDTYVPSQPNYIITRPEDNYMNTMNTDNSFAFYNSEEYAGV